MAARLRKKQVQEKQVQEEEVGLVTVEYRSYAPTTIKAGGDCGSSNTPETSSFDDSDFDEPGRIISKRVVHHSESVNQHTDEEIVHLEGNDPAHNTAHSVLESTRGNGKNEVAETTMFVETQPSPSDDDSAETKGLASEESLWGAIEAARDYSAKAKAYSEAYVARCTSQIDDSSEADISVPGTGSVHYDGLPNEKGHAESDYYRPFSPLFSSKAVVHKSTEKTTETPDRPWGALGKLLRKHAAANEFANEELMALDDITIDTTLYGLTITSGDGYTEAWEDAGSSDESNTVRSRRSDDSFCIAFKAADQKEILRDVSRAMFACSSSDSMV